MEIVENTRKVIISREEVARFCASFPCSGLRDRSYWFEFDDDLNLVDTDVPEHDDGVGALALADDAKAFLLETLLTEATCQKELTREERTANVIAKFRGLPGEFYMLKGLLCLEAAVCGDRDVVPQVYGWEQRREEERKISALLDGIAVARRMDEINADIFGGKS